MEIDVKDILKPIAIIFIIILQSFIIYIPLIFTLFRNHSLRTHVFGIENLNNVSAITIQTLEGANRTLKFRRDSYYFSYAKKYLNPFHIPKLHINETPSLLYNINNAHLKPIMRISYTVSLRFFGDFIVTTEIHSINNNFYNLHYFLGNRIFMFKDSYSILFFTNYHPPLSVIGGFKYNFY